MICLQYFYQYNLIRSIIDKVTIRRQQVQLQTLFEENNDAIIIASHDQNEI